MPIAPQSHKVSVDPAMHLRQGFSFSTFLTQGSPVNKPFHHGTPELLLESYITLRYENIHIFPPEIHHVTKKFPSDSISSDRK